MAELSEAELELCATATLKRHKFQGLPAPAQMLEYLAAEKAEGFSDAPPETRGSDCEQCGGAGWWKPQGADRVKRCACVKRKGARE